MHLSKIKAGRPLADGGYAAVVRFRLLPFLIPLAVILMAFVIVRSISPKASVKEEETTEHIIMPEPESATAGILQNEYAGLYISIPGYTDFRVSAAERGLVLYNPPDNRCLLQYQIYIQDEPVASTGKLEAGASETLDFYDRLSAGIYTVTLIARAYSQDGKTEFNTVSQQITLQSE